MAGPIEFACPKCARVARVPRELAGKQARCPGCKKVLEIPRPPADEPPRAPKLPPPPAPGEGETASAAAPSPAAGTPNVAGLLRALPKPLLLGLVAAAVLPIVGGPLCALFALRAPAGSPAKKWGRIGLGIAVLTWFLHANLHRANAPPPPGGGVKQGPRIAPKPPKPPRGG